jgi:hypothetical protein
LPRPSARWAAGRLEQSLAVGRRGERGHLLGERQPGDLAEHRVGEERVERALQPEQQAHGPRRHLGAHGDAVGVGLAEQVEQAAPVAAQALDHRERQGPARPLGHGPEQPELGVEVGEVGHRLEDALPVAPMASAMPISSSASAVRVGVGSPLLVRWLSVREVVKPSAPAATAWAASSAMAAMSSAVAGSRAAPRSPMTLSRRAPWGTCRATSTSNGRAR